MKTKMKTKKIIILTESSKFKNNCVAGIEKDTGKWIRVVSDDEDTYGALTKDDIMYKNGTMCEVMDIVNVPYVKAVPTKTQPENILIDRNYYLTKDGVATLDDVLEIHPKEINDYLFGTRYSSVKEEYLEELGVDYSLTLIKVKKLVFNWRENNKGQLKLKVTFKYNDIKYEDMSVTDPDFYEVGEGTTLKKAYVVASIGTPYNGACYKFIAKVFPIDDI